MFCQMLHDLLRGRWALYIVDVTCCLGWNYFFKASLWLNRNAYEGKNCGIYSWFPSLIRLLRSREFPLEIFWPHGFMRKASISWYDQSHHCLRNPSDLISCLWTSMIFKDQDLLVILAKSQVFLTRWEDQLTNCVGVGGTLKSSPSLTSQSTAVQGSASHRIKVTNCHRVQTETQVRHCCYCVLSSQTVLQLLVSPFLGESSISFLRNAFLLRKILLSSHSFEDLQNHLLLVT